MKRKLIPQKSAFTITLPIDWIRDRNLKPADEIELIEEGNNLVLSTDKKASQDKIELNLEKGNESYYRIMIENHYLKGFDIIEVTYEDKNALKHIKNIVANLNGIEIVEQHGTYCRISQTSIPS